MVTQSYMPENYRVFSPDPIETSLAQNVDNPLSPSAAALLGYYQTKGRNDRADYQAQLAGVRDQQAQQFAITSGLERSKVLQTSLQEAAKVRGGTDIARQLGLLPQADYSAVDAGTAKAADAKELGEAGNGLGRLGLANVTGLDTALQRYVPGAVQGVNPQIGAAQITADGRRDAAAIGAGGRGGLTYKLDGTTGAVETSGRAQPGESPDAFKVRVGNGVAPTSLRQQVTNKADASARGVTPPLPMAQADPGGAMPPPPVAAAPTVVPGRTNVDVARELVTRNLSVLQQKSPDVYADVIAGRARNGGQFNIVADGNQWKIVGASGRRYEMGTR